MNSFSKKLSRYGIILLFVLAGWLRLVGRSEATPPSQFDDPVEQGRYLATIAGCVDCHTPLQAAFQDPTNLTAEQVRTLAFFSEDALDTARLFAGGKTFDLGPLGIINVPNLTPDAETGLGNWTDEEIKAAFQAGVRPDGRKLFPLMPYLVFNNMAESDADAIVAYLRSLPPVRNEVPSNAHIPTAQLPDLSVQPGITAPAPTETAARGRYLASAIMACGDCHTPTDPSSGQPMVETMYLAGGQPFEGPWGIVYGGNITPHPETGLGEWTDTEIKRVLSAGVSRDGRRLIVMPWQFFSAMTADDLDAIVYFLRNDLTPVENDVPAASVNPDFVEQVEIIPTEESGPNVALLAAAAVVLILLVVGLVLFTRRQSAVGGKQ